MKRRDSVLAIVLAPVLAAGGRPARAEPDDPPTPEESRSPLELEAEFVVATHGVDVARTRWSVRRLDDDRFVYESRTRTTGMASVLRDDRILERSEWRMIDDRLQPLAYSYDRHRGDRRREVSVRFDWPAGKVRNTANGHDWEMEVPLGTLDKLSYLLVMMRDLRRGKRRLRYRIADGGSLKTYSLRVVAEEVVATPQGPRPALKVQRLRDDDERDTVLWCAAAFGYLPVRIEHREVDGAQFELSLRRADGPAARGV